MDSGRSDSNDPTWGRLVSTTLIVVGIITGISYMAFVVAIPFGWLAQPESRVGVFLVGAAIGQLTGLAVLRWLLGRRSISLRDLGLGRPAPPFAFVLGTGFAAAYSYVTILNPEVRAHIFDFGTLKVIALVSAALIAAVVEEVIFRGYIMTEVQQMGYGPVVQVLVSALAFSVAHLYAFASLQALLLTMAYTFVLATALAIVYIVGRRSLTAPIVSHALINAVIQPALLISLFTGPGM